MTTLWQGTDKPIDVFKRLHGITVGSYTFTYDSDVASSSGKLIISGPNVTNDDFYFNVALPGIRPILGFASDSHFVPAGHARPGSLLVSPTLDFSRNAASTIATADARGSVVGNTYVITSRFNSNNIRNVLFTGDIFTTSSHLLVTVGAGASVYTNPSTESGAALYIDKSGTETVSGYAVGAQGIQFSAPVPAVTTVFSKRMDSDIATAVYNLAEEVTSLRDYPDVTTADIATLQQRDSDIITRVSALESRQACDSDTFTALVADLNARIDLYNGTINTLVTRLNAQDSEIRVLKTKTAPITVNPYGAVTMRSGQSSITLSPGGMQISVARNPAFPAFGSGSVLGIDASNINFQSANAIVSGNVSVTGGLDIGRNITRGGATIL